MKKHGIGLRIEPSEYKYELIQLLRKRGQLFTRDALVAKMINLPAQISGGPERVLIEEDGAVVAYLYLEAEANDQPICPQVERDNLCASTFSTGLGARAQNDRRRNRIRLRH